MNKREFERELWTAVQGYWGDNNWKDKRGRTYGHVMDDLANNTDAEQWLIVDLTLDMLHIPDFITGEVPCDMPVSRNEWADDFDTPLDTPATGYQKPDGADYETVLNWLPEDDRPDQPPDPFWRVDSPTDQPVAPLGWWFCIDDMIPQRMTAEQAMNYTGPFATEREAFIAVLKRQGEIIDQLVAELNALRPVRSAEYQLP